MLSFFADVLLLFFSQPEARSESTVTRASWVLAAGSAGGRPARWAKHFGL